MREQDRFIVIRASAGSGKTYRLSGRYLTLLRRGVDPSHILATTFTRKAAGEVLGRVLTRLGDAVRDPSKTRQLGEALGDLSLDAAAARAMLVSLAASLHRVGVSTIDAQMHRMAMCYRFELGLPPAPRLVEGGGAVARQLRRRAIDAMLADDTPDVLIPLLRRLQHDAAQRRISDALDEMFSGLYAIYRQTDPAAWHAIAPPPTLDREQVELAIDAVRTLGDALPGDKRWRKAWLADLDAAAAHNWTGLLGGGLAGVIASGADSYYKQPLPDEVAAAYHALIRHAQAVMIAQVLDKTAAMHDLLKRFDTHYTSLRRQQGIVLFDDLPVMLGGVFGGAAPPELETLYFRLDTTVGHLLLDEFQDTAPIQWRVLRPFAQEIRSTDEGGRTFFCVGDVKQAIYGWRGACAAIFDRVIDDLSLPDESLQSMNVSYRSSQVVLDAVNAVFGSIAQAPPLAELREHAAPWAEGFEHHTANDQALTGYVELTATGEPIDASATRDDDDDDDAMPAAEAHLDAVARRVAALASAHPARTIGLLVSRNATAARLLGMLRDRGVEASGEGGAALDQDPAVELMLAAMRLADHPGDTAAAFHLLHSPLAQSLGLTGLGDAVRAAASRQTRRRLLDDGYASVLAQWAHVLRPALGPRGVERVSQLIELAERHDPLRPLRTREFIEFVRSSRVEDPTPARVRVMTIHKSKGLEFDIVVLGELSRVMGKVDQLVWQGGADPTQPPDLVISHANKDLRPTLFAYDAAIERAYDRQRASRLADDLSGFYVAMTRAKRAVHLLVEPLRRTKSGKWSSRGLDNATAASVLRHQLGGADPVIASGVLYAHGDAGWDRDAEPVPPPGVSRRPALSLSADAAEPRWWRARRPSGQEAGGKVAVAGLLDVEAHQGRRFGTRVHEALAAIEYLEPGQLPDDPLIAPMFEHDAVRAVFTPCDAGEALWRERSFAVRIDGQLVRGVFDRVAVRVDERGRPTAATLTDFKTDAHSDAAVERYRPQIELYRQALARMLGLDTAGGTAGVAARLLFTREGVVVSV